MVNYEVAVRKPFTDMMKLLIGILLSIIPIINATVVTGFAIESSGLGRTKPSKKMPEWKDWWYLFIKGLGAVLIKIIYLIPAIVVLIIGIGLAFSNITGGALGAVYTPEAMSQISAVFNGDWHMFLPTLISVAPIIIVGAVLAVIALFLAPMAVLNYVKNRRFSAAFDIGTVVKKAVNGKYILAWIVMSVLTIVLGAILAFIPLLGPAIVLFVVGVISYSLYGQIYKEV